MEYTFRHNFRHGYYTININIDLAVNEPSNLVSQRFYDMLYAIQRPVWPTSPIRELEAIVRLTSIESNYIIAHNIFNVFARLMKVACPTRNEPYILYGVKKIIVKFRLIILMATYCIIWMI